MKTKDKKLIFNLPIDENSAILAYELPEYDTIYEGAELWVKVGRHKYKVARRNFVYFFGADMYYRFHNVWEYGYGTAEFLDEYINEWNRIDWDNCGGKWADIIDSSMLYSDVIKERTIFFYKLGDKYNIIFAEIQRCSQNKYKIDKIKVIKDSCITEPIFLAWKQVVAAAFEKGFIREKKVCYDKAYSQEELEEILKSFRT